MDSEQVEKTFKELVDRYGDQFPNHAHEPRRFLYYIRLMRWNKELEKFSVDSKPKQ